MKHTRKDSIVSSPNNKLHFVINDETGRPARCFQDIREAQHLDELLKTHQQLSETKPPAKDDK